MFDAEVLVLNEHKMVIATYIVELSLSFNSFKEFIENLENETKLKFDINDFSIENKGKNCLIVKFSDSDKHCKDYFQNSYSDPLKWYYNYRLM